MYNEFYPSAYQTNTFLGQVGTEKHNKNVFKLIRNIFFDFLELKVEKVTKIWGFYEKFLTFVWWLLEYHFVKTDRNVFFLPSKL